MTTRSFIGRELEDMKDETLSQISEKPKMSVVDIAIILSTMYGVGAAMGITAGGGLSIAPSRKSKPTLFYASTVLLALGVYKGFITATKYRTLTKELSKQSAIERELEEYVPTQSMYVGNKNRSLS